jgi:hypothetical protein
MLISITTRSGSWRCSASHEVETVSVSAAAVDAEIAEIAEIEVATTGRGAATRSEAKKTLNMAKVVAVDVARSLSAGAKLGLAIWRAVPEL